MSPNENGKVILAIDGGGSRTRCAAFGLNGEFLADVETGPSNHLQVERELVVTSLTEAVRAVMAKCGRELRDVICLSAGLAGVDVDGIGRDEMAEIL
ncbi:MAG: BadF/BadG/BcrA/BcrD ATPase family protein, partial [Acidobacteriota bacterium]